MLANITFKAYDLNYKDNKKNEDNLLLEFTLPLADTDKLDTITNAIESAYEFSNPISWAISIDHEYI